MLIRSFILVSCIFLAASAFSATTSVVIASPRGGEVFVAGQNQFIRLDDRTKLKTVTLEISRDGGTTFFPLGTIDNTVKVGRNVLQFGVTGPTSTNCVIRATGIQGKTQITGLSGAFSIVTGNSLGPIATPELADGAVTTPKLADRAATEVKIGSGATSADMFLKSDGLGGAIFAALSGDGSGITSISEAALPASVTVQGNSFNVANKLLQLDANGFAAPANLPTVPLEKGGTGASLAASNGGVLYSNPNSVAILPGVVNAGRMLQSGASSAPAWSTATYPSVSGGVGKVLISDGANFVASGPAFPTASGAAGKVVMSDGTNFVASTPKFPIAAAATGKVLISDGTDFVPSTSTYPGTAGPAGKLLLSDGNNFVQSTPLFPTAPGAAGKVIMSDGTNFVASAPAFPTAAGEAGKVLVSDGTNFVTASLSSPPGGAPAGKFLISDGTNYIPSTPTLPNSSGAAGNVLQSDGTNFISAPPPASQSVPSVRVYHDANQSVPPGQPDLTLFFNRERFDTDNIHDTSINASRLTCKTAGKYLIIANIQWSANSSGARQLHMLVNGSISIALVQDTAATTGVTRQHVSTVYPLAVNDYVTIAVNHSSGGALSIDTLSAASPEFMMVRIAD